MTPPLAAIFFDFDGVIVNSEPLHCAAFRSVLAAENIDLTDAMYYAEMIGFDDRGAFRHIYARLSLPLDDATFARLLLAKERAVQDALADGTTRALPGVDALVRQLAKHFPLAICSGALRGEIVPMLAGIGLTEFFPTIVAAEDVPVSKPDPACYLLTAKRVGERVGKILSPAECLIIEDAPSVIRAVMPLGFQTIGVATSHPVSALSHATAAVTTLDPAGLKKLFPGLPLI